jgi:hypothetical protein
VPGSCGGLFESLNDLASVTSRAQAKVVDCAEDCRLDSNCKALVWTWLHESPGGSGTCQLKITAFGTFTGQSNNVHVAKLAKEGNVQGVSVAVD